ncbi:hypothetical protein DFS34DRAFT_591496 [Phlyctochytrium arcticum]|nr:hypothetical protein DFS34DRAFT_591496 [Phlyctochytrium arcticum]
MHLGNRSPENVTMNSPRTKSRTCNGRLIVSYCEKQRMSSHTRQRRQMNEPEHGTALLLTSVIKDERMDTVLRRHRKEEEADALLPANEEVGPYDPLKDELEELDDKLSAFFSRSLNPTCFDFELDMNILRAAKLHFKYSTMPENEAAWDKIAGEVNETGSTLTGEQVRDRVEHLIQWDRDQQESEMRNARGLPRSTNANLHIGRRAAILLIETVGEFPYQNRLEDIHDSWEKVADAVNQYFGVPGHNMNGQQARKRVEYLLQWHRDLERQEPLEDENFVPDYDEKRQLLTDLDDVLDNFELDREAVELGTMSKSESKTLCSDRGNYFKDCSLGEGLRRAAIAEMAKRARLMSEGQF